MKFFIAIFTIIFSLNILAGPGTFPQGDHVKLLKNQLEFKGGLSMGRGVINPQVTAVDALLGSLHIFNSDYYIKQDAGSTTNWDVLFKLPVNTPDGYVLVSDSFVSRGYVPKRLELNYIINSDIETSITGYNTYSDAAGSIPIDGTGGTGSFALLRTTGTPLMGTAHLRLFKAATNEQGEGVSYDFTIDNALQAQILRISFRYDTSHANYADDDIRIFIYDVTNSNLIRISGEDLKGGQGNFIGSFQSAPDSTSYRLIFHIATPNATTYALGFDNISVKPQEIVSGTIALDWRDVDLSWSGTGGTVTSKMSRVADTAYFDVHINATGAFGGTPSRIILTGFSPDMDKVSGGSSIYTSLGTATFRDNSGVIRLGSVSFDGLVGGDAEIRILVDDGAAGQTRSITNTAPWTWANLDEISLNFKLPILGWASSAGMSSDVGSREVLVRAAGNNGAAITENVTNINFTEIEDTTSSFDGTTFIAPESGMYFPSGSMRWTGGGVTQPLVRAYVNGVVVKSLGYERSASSSIIQSFGGLLKLIKGDALTFRIDGVIGESMSNVIVNHHLVIIKLANPQTVFSSERVSAIYNSNAGQVLSNGVQTKINYEDKVEDTHNAVSIGALWRFVAPYTGLYSVKVMNNIIANATGSRVVNLRLINSSFAAIEIVAPSVGEVVAQVSQEIPMVKGEYIEVEIFQNSGVALPLTTSSNRNRISIHRIK